MSSVIASSSTIGSTIAGLPTRGHRLEAVAISTATGVGKRLAVMGGLVVVEAETAS